jgi:GntR family transcriptional regulator/MocR family aminotransferase
MRGRPASGSKLDQGRQAPPPLTLGEGDRPVFVRLADAVREAIRRGDLPAGAAVPSSRELAAQLKIHRHTVRAGLDQLVAEGWLAVTQRQGYRVCEGDVAPPSTAASTAEHRFRFVSDVSLSPFSPGGVPIVHNFQSGIPDLRLFPTEEFKTFVTETLRESRTELLDYSHPSGWPPLKEAVARYLMELRGITGRKVIIANGSQEAIYLTMRLLVAPGDDVAIEDLTYPPARETLRLLGARLHPLRMDRHGIDPDALDRLARRRRLRLLFLTPTHQFPTTLNLPADRRVEILRIAAKHRIPIIEDDYDHEFHFDAEPPRPLAALDEASLVIYLSTFSKVLFPSARLAFMAVPAAFAERYCQMRRLLTHQNDSIVQDALARWMADGGYHRHLRRMRKTYQQRRDAMTAALERQKAAGRRYSWTSPRGGMALWLDAGSDSARLAELGKSKGIFLSSEADYRVRAAYGSHLRLGFSHLSEAEIEAGIEALGTLSSQAGRG